MSGTLVDIIAPTAITTTDACADLEGRRYSGGGGGGLDPPPSKFKLLVTTL